MKICFNVATDMRSMFAWSWNLGESFTGHILDEANYDPDAETRFLCEFIPVPAPFSDRVVVYENWGRVIDDNLALDVGLTTPESIQLLNESGLLDGKTVVIMDVNVGGFAYERINEHAHIGIHSEDSRVVSSHQVIQVRLTQLPPLVRI